MRGVGVYSHLIDSLLLYSSQRVVYETLHYTHLQAHIVVFSKSDGLLKATLMIRVHGLLYIVS